jgi:hypothetical protein
LSRAATISCGSLEACKGGIACGDDCGKRHTPLRGHGAMSAAPLLSNEGRRPGVENCTSRHGINVVRRWVACAIDPPAPKAARRDSRLTPRPALARATGSCSTTSAAKHRGRSLGRGPSSCLRGRARRCLEAPIAASRTGTCWLLGCGSAALWRSPEERWESAGRSGRRCSRSCRVGRSRAVR